jgi:cellulose synthase/poly-beta-1,6-N-acetylglucosamine synthase-like glycosyltransferase
MITLIFWAAGILVAYPYAIYPALLGVLTRGRVRHSPSGDGGAEPTLTLVISAHNEEAVIREKLRNSSSLDYPPEKLDIIVVSDASTDGTDDVVREEQALDGRVRLLRQPTRRGKSVGLNAAVDMAKGEIVVFSDANAIYESKALRELVRPFRDPHVGYVVGAALYSGTAGSTAADSEGIYWRLELRLKRLESELGCVVGGDGAIYAIRRSLFQPLRADDISDFVNPLQIVARGYRGCFSGAARCYERPGESFAEEFRRRRRIVNRSWRAVRRYAPLLEPCRDGRFIFMLLSHKIIRWLALPLLLIAWVANCFLWKAGAPYPVTWCLITGSAVIAAFGALLESKRLRPPRFAATIAYFYMINMAGLLGIWDEFRGVRHVTWNHIRNTSP